MNTRSPHQSIFISEIAEVSAKPLRVYDGSGGRDVVALTINGAVTELSRIDAANVIAVLSVALSRYPD